MDHQSTPKRQKPCTVAPFDTDRTNNGTAQAPSNSKPTHIKCEVCQQTLPQHLFPKKKFANKATKKKNQSNNNNNSTPSLIITCRQCKKNQTAQRCKQPTKPQIKLGRTSDSGMERRPNNFGYCNYLDKLFSLKCFPDIVALRAFTSAKDVSESMAAIQAANQHGLWNDAKKQKKNVKVNCLCIGDGSTPRTAVLACFLHKWDCISIDPALHEDWRGVNPKGVRGLTGFGGTLEEFLLQSNNQSSNGDNDDATSTTKYDHLVLLCVHSHARLTGNASVPNIMALYNNIPTTLISLPCCPKFRSQKDVGRVPDVVYEDDCVFSACRRVEVWNFDFTVCVFLTQKALESDANGTGLCGTTNICQTVTSTE